MVRKQGSNIRVFDGNCFFYNVQFLLQPDFTEGLRTVKGQLLGQLSSYRNSNFDLTFNNRTAVYIKTRPSVFKPLISGSVKGRIIGSM